MQSVLSSVMAIRAVGVGGVIGLMVFLSLALAQPVATPKAVHYVSDELLTTTVQRVHYRLTKANHRWWDWRHRQLRVTLTAVVENAATQTVAGPLRVVLDVPKWLQVRNADAAVALFQDVGSNRYPVIQICDDCQLAAGAHSNAFTIQLQMPLYRAFRWYREFGLLTQYQPFKLQLLHTADMDGTAGALQNVVGFSAILQSFKASYPDNTLVLSSGDNYIPGPRFAACSDDALTPLIGVAGQGRCDIAFMNAMGFQASVVGNHDLDSGTAGFADIIAAEVDAISGAIYQGAQFPYLSANLDFSTDVDLAPLVTADGQNAADAAGKLAAYSIIEVAGESVGLVGATTPTLASITNTGGITIKPNDAANIAALAAEIQVSVDALTKQGVNKVIVLAHMQQIALEQELATLLRDVDVIVAGGSNTLLADDNDVLRDGDIAAGTYPLVLTSAKGEPVLVVNTDGDYQYLGRLISAFDLQGRVILDSLNKVLNGAYATDTAGLNAIGLSVAAADADVIAITTALTNVLAERDGNILGRATVYLDGRRSAVRTQETNLGNLTADANLALAQQIDPTTVVSIKNAGGIRSEIGFATFPPGATNPDDLQFFPTAPNPAAGKLAGDISQFDIETTLRFNNGLSLLTMTAAELQAVVEHSVAATEAGATPGSFPQISGMRFSFDPSLPANSRVLNLAIVDASGVVLDVIVQNGVLVGDVNRGLRIVTLNFLADGGDGFPFPAGVDANRVDLVDSGLVPVGATSFAAEGSEQDALAEYLLQNTLSGVAFDRLETPMSDDLRIQNVSVRDDAVL